MPDIIVRTLQGAPLLLQWYQWGVIVGFVGALAVTAWIFVDAQRAAQDATLWKSLSAVASVVGIPALLAREHAGFAFEMRDALSLVAGLSIAGAVLTVVALFGYSIGRRRSPSVCPMCDQPQQPGWTQCPYHPNRQQVLAPVPIADATRPLFRSSTETLVGDRPVNRLSVGSTGVQRGTVILGREEEPRPLALLIINSGPYANTTLPLKAGVTTLGRNGQVNDHPVDDAAVSERHVSIRYQDGRFVATDLDSTNGTFVNDERIERQALQSGDVMRIGKTHLFFVQVSTVEQAMHIERDGTESLDTVR
jgi:FHA domain